MKSGRKGRRKILNIIISGIIATIMAAITVPVFKGYIEMVRVTEATSIMGAIITSQKVEKRRTTKYYSASTIAEFKAKGVDVSKAKSFIFETFPTPDGGFTVRGTPKNASGAAEGSMTYTYPPPPHQRSNRMICC